MRKVLLPLLLTALVLPARADTGAMSLQVDWAVDGAVTVGAVVLVGVGEFGSDSLAPSSCRWCSTTGLDADARKSLRWSNAKVAGDLSNVLLLSMPVGITAYDFFTARAAGGRMRQTADDLLVIAEAVAVTGVATEIAKYAVARQRPYAFYGAGTSSRDDHLSFFSGHVSTTFAMAAAGGVVAQTQGYSGWPWVYGIGFTAAATTSYFRMAADKHWLTDVLASAAAGTAVGIGLPWLHRRAVQHVRLLPMPGGLTVAGRF